MTMYEYYKMILEKVHFEPTIFKKELKKALCQFNKEEKTRFLEWCKTKFRTKNSVQEHKNIPQESVQNMVQERYSVTYNFDEDRIKK
jgi:hypothetical protein